VTGGRTLRVSAESWPLRRPFAIARGTKTTAEVVVAEIACGGVTGRGECVPYPRYGETATDVVAAIEALASAIADGLDRDTLTETLPPGAARNAVDCALWDLEAKAAGRRAWDLAGLEVPEPTVTAETIGLGTVEDMAADAAALTDRPLLKVKVGCDAVVERLQAVRDAAPAARLVVDANEGWDLEILQAVGDDLAALGVEMIEQPLPAGDGGGLDADACPVPLCADESCHTAADLGRLVGRYRLVNIKLDKTGGLTGALDLARAARAVGFGIMVGCMVGTSLAMAPATLLTGFADVVDLDGPLWLARDRDPGLRFENGTVFPPDAALWG